ncbi:CidB/LrgB family autolysis modulator [Vibrio marisflavi]|uniref:Inner membrane protein YohK n=1 Tax=Vibrio marisflavi CECT 7928 TaxID=634439 RepID=A0ABM9A4N6_9VIBR|nr:CidB/LrgB family autolysis modulator [Vibrio marisflavi]CAH0539678.1 Inner membrane protein YohK [Vibrio marisflavi CECT 7928]
MWFILTVVLYIIAKWISNKANTPFLNPLLVSVAAIIGVLILFNIPFEHYYAQNEFVTFLLQPAVVALAYPLYEQLPQIRQNWKVILLTCTIGSSMSMFSATLLAAYFQANPTLLASVVAKSVTTPIAMVISSHLGGEPAITAILVLIVGLFGSIIAYPVYSILNITHPIARGLTMGTVSHALGTATAAEKTENDAAYSSLALVICGVITSILAPAFFSLSIWLSHFF